VLVDTGESYSLLTHMRPDSVAISWFNSKKDYPAAFLLDWNPHRDSCVWLRMPWH